MSSYSTITLGLGLFATTVQQAFGHGQLSRPYPRGGIGNDIQKAQVWNLKGGAGEKFGVGGKFSGDSFRCHDNTQPQPRDQWSTLTAGQQFTFEVDYKASHPGDCSLHVSVPNTKDNIKDPWLWYKILDWPGCGSTERNWSNSRQKVSKTFTLPKGMPACDHCVLRWEWAAVHMAADGGDTQFYTTCHDIKVNNPVSDYKIKSGEYQIGYGISHLQKNYGYTYHRNPYVQDNWPENGVYGPPIAQFESPSKMKEEEEAKKAKEEEEAKKAAEEEAKKAEEVIIKPEDNSAGNQLGVDLYQECDESYGKVTLGVGSYTKTALAEKGIEYLKMPKPRAGYMVTLFAQDNFEGKYVVLMGDKSKNKKDPCYSELIDSETINSIVISKFA
eukprot:Pgem_evm1s5534